MPAAKRARPADNGSMVSSTLEVLEPYQTNELSTSDRQCATSEARAVVQKLDKVLEKMLDVRIITTKREGCFHNHVNLRVASEFSCMVHHERALMHNASDIMFCFMASSELEPVVVVVLLDGDHGRLVHLTRGHFDFLGTALQQFRVRFGLVGE